MFLCVNTGSGEAVSIVCEKIKYTFGSRHSLVAYTVSTSMDTSYADATFLLKA